MKSQSNEMSRRAADSQREKPSRAAEYITALYVALVLLTPWLLRDASLFSPSKGVEIQMGSKAAPAPAPALTKAAAPPIDPNAR